jgi:hypothetical protein
MAANRAIPVFDGQLYITFDSKNINLVYENNPCHDLFFISMQNWYSTGNRHQSANRRSEKSYQH